MRIRVKVIGRIWHKDFVFYNRVRELDRFYEIGEEFDLEKRYKLRLLGESERPVGYDHEEDFNKILVRKEKHVVLWRIGCVVDGERFGVVPTLVVEQVS